MLPFLLNILPAAVCIISHGQRLVKLDGWVSFALEPWRDHKQKEQSGKEVSLKREQLAFRSSEGPQSKKMSSSHVHHCTGINTEHSALCLLVARLPTLITFWGMELHYGLATKQGDKKLKQT